MIRFRPPSVGLSPEVRWMVLRAFGPAAVPFPDPVDGTACLALARRFELSARIASRSGRERLAAELGEETAAGFRRDQSITAALGLRLLAVAREVAEAAVPLDLPLVFLKFVALDAAGLPVIGARSACDVDVLVPAAREGELQQALLARDYHDSGLPEGEHQLPSLTHPGGGKVEVHRRMPGVRPASGRGARSATVETLTAAGLLVPVPGLPGRCAVPTREVLAAHALVHGLGQHGFWPDSYPLFKMVGDLVDLGFAGGGTLEATLPWVSRDVAPAEAEAVRRLCGALAEGTDAAEWPEAAGETVLLRHILAGRLDPDYAAAMRLGFFHSQPSDHPPALRLLRSMLDAVFLTRAQIDAVYGPPRHPLGYLGRRLARPFDLLRRLGSYGVKALRVRS
jgi:hypothetical protein